METIKCLPELGYKINERISYKIPNMNKSIDKFITLPMLKQIGWLVASLIGLILLFFSIGFTLEKFSIESSVYETEMRTLRSEIAEEQGQIKEPSEIKCEDKLWYITSRLIDPGYLGESENKWFSFSIIIIGWLLCTVLLIAIITNSYEVRIDKVASGQVRYRFKKHNVILGCNQMTISLIKQIREKETKGAKSAIIIHSEQDSKELRAYLKDHLSSQEEKSLYIYRGERESKEQLETLCLDYADTVFVLGEKDENGVDSSNVECVRRISEIISQSKELNKKKIPCYLYLENQTTFSLLQQHDMEIKIRNYIDLQPFNHHENWARTVFSGKKNDNRDYSTVYSKIKFDTDINNLRFVIIGFNRMGRALAVQCARVAHFGNNSKTIITVIDKNAGELKDSFLSQFPGLPSMTDIEFDFLNKSIESKSTKDTISEWCNNDEIMGIAMCFRNPDTSLFQGLKLPKSVYNKDIPVLIRQDYLHGFASSINDKAPFENVNFFGMLYDTCTLDFDRDDKAKKLHANYLTTLSKREPELYPSHNFWETLPEEYRWSNRYPTDIYPVKFKMLNKVSTMFSANKFQEYKLLLLDTINILKKNNQTFEELHSNLSKDKKQIVNDIELLAKIEHKRWIAEKVIAGWSYGKVRDNIQLFHPDLIPYEQLAEEKKNFDRLPSVNMFKIINEQEILDYLKC